MFASTVLPVKMLSEHADREVNFIPSSYLNKPSVSLGFHRRLCILKVSDNDLHSDLGNTSLPMYPNCCFIRKDMIIVSS
jgi:hypothetical protein